MVKQVVRKLLILGLIFLFSGCSNSPEDEPSLQLRGYTFIDFGLTLQDTLLQAYQSDLNLTRVLVEDTYRIMESFEEMTDRVTTSNALTVEFINILTKDQRFKEGYNAVFSINSAYDLTGGAYFTMTSLDVNKTYMLVSSSTRLFVPETTIKTLFNDNSSLNAAWQRSIDNHPSGNMYLNIYEIESNGTVQRAGIAAVIPATVLATY